MSEFHENMPNLLVSRLLAATAECEGALRLEYVTATNGVLGGDLAADLLACTTDDALRVTGA
jgi:hypothetical protein